MFSAPNSDPLPSLQNTSSKVTPLVLYSSPLQISVGERREFVKRYRRNSSGFEHTSVLLALDSRQPHNVPPALTGPFHISGKGFNFTVQAPTPNITASSPSFQRHARYASDFQISHSESAIVKYPRSQPLSVMSILTSSPTTPTMHLPLDIPVRSFSVTSNASYENQMKPPKSPAGNRLTSLFRWQSTSSHESNTTTSIRVQSPPMSPKTLGPSFKTVPPMIDTLRANADHTNIYPSDASLSLPSLTPGLGSYDSIEDELRMLSAELVASIIREIELEDLVEKLETEAAGASNVNQEKRTSDYFSDVGTPDRNLYASSIHEQELGKVKRHYEQEKAQIQLEMLAKLSEERQRRANAETQVKELEDHVSRGEHSQSASTDAGKVKALETALDDAKRKLAEEKQARENFEQLVTTIKTELEGNMEERDRLRDDVVPKLHQRVMDLEAETAQLQQIMDDKAKLQQEINALQHENKTLISCQRKPLDIRVITPAEKRISLAQMQGLAAAQPGSLPSPLSPKEKETLAEKLREVEQQRDELQKALRSLRERQKFENRQAALKIKTLESERDRALRFSPRKFANNREVQYLRREVDRLRARAEEALEAKFKCERNLGSLKMDLERAEQETAVLRALLQEHDALVTQHEELQDSHIRLSKQVSEMGAGHSETTSASLYRAYRDLLLTHELTLDRLGELEVKECDWSEDSEERQRKLMAAHEVSEKALKKLRQSLADAEAERNLAQTEADAYKRQATALQQAEKCHLVEERSLAVQLKESTERVQQLAVQVQAQMQSNEALRGRLAAAIDRGESEQQASANMINELQARLKQLEDRVISAQQETEDAIDHHEEEIRLMQANHSTQLTRLKATLRESPGPVSPRMPLTPLLRSPKLEWASKVGGSNDSPGNSSERMEFLEKKVFELERALADADKEMREVVSRMSMAQIEVMELTSQRDNAARETRNLQAQIAMERTKYTQLVSVA